MSLMDDVFDIKAHLKGTEYERAFDNITKALWFYENKYDELKQQVSVIDDFAKLIKERGENK